MLEQFGSMQWLPSPDHLNVTMHMWLCAQMHKVGLLWDAGVEVALMLVFGRELLKTREELHHDAPVISTACRSSGGTLKRESTNILVPTYCLRWITRAGIFFTWQFRTLILKVSCSWSVSRLMWIPESRMLPSWLLCIWLSKQAQRLLSAIW